MIHHLIAEPHSIFFYLLLLIMGMGILQSVSIGGLFFFKQSGVKRGNYYYGVLLICIGLTLLHNVFVITGFYELYPAWYFLPIYYTLALPTLLFYYVKFTLYPAYRLKISDVKHFILPGGQFAFFVVLFFSPVAYKSQIGRDFFNPFFGALEQLLYLTTFFAYMYFAYRYIRHKKKAMRHPKEARQIMYLSKLIEILFVLFAIHAVFVVADFVSYDLLNINMRDSKIYAAAGVLSFAALVFWLGTYGFQVLLWGRRVFKS